jgi:hypothetical protein
MHLSLCSIEQHGIICGIHEYMYYMSGTVHDGVYVVYFFYVYYNVLTV